jgi:hypothetical protein
VNDVHVFSQRGLWLRVFAVTLAAWAVTGWGAAGAAGASLFALPPLAVADPVAGWQDGRTGAGGLAGSLEIARRDFAKALAGQGWTPRDEGLVMGRRPNRSVLQVWARGGRELSLLVWESGAGRCRFQWGMEDVARQRSMSQ